MSSEAGLFIRLYLDEDVHKRVASALRTLFTYNTADFLRLHLDWLLRGQEHAGIIVSDQLAIGETVRRLLNLLNRVTADEMRNHIRWLQAFK